MKPLRSIQNTTSNEEESLNNSAKIIPLYVSPPLEPPHPDFLLEMLWQFTKACWWIDKDFSNSDEKKLKQTLSQYLYVGKDPTKTFEDLVQRIALSKVFSTDTKSSLLIQPALWLNKDFPMGLSRTLVLLNQVNDIRKNQPHYHRGIATLAKGLFAYCQAGEKTVIKKYRSLLIKQKETELLSLFYHTIIHFTHLR